MTRHRSLGTSVLLNRTHPLRRRIGAAVLLFACAANAQQTTSQSQQTDDVESIEASSQDAPGDGDASAGAFVESDDSFADLSLEELMDIPVVVTASRHEQKLSTVAQAISVITAEEIRASGARSVPDALRLVPGMDVADLSYSNYAVSPRGFHGFLGRQVLVLVDGRQIFDSHFGGSLWGIWPFLLEDIARIEVIRGPGGVSWGANAVNGVINIITKDPADQLGMTLIAGGGSYGTHKEYVGYAVQDDNFRIRVSTEYEGSDGFRRGGSILGKPYDDYKSGRGSIYGVYDKGPNDEFTFSAGSAVLDGGFPRSPLAGIGWYRNPAAQSSYLMGKWSHQTSADNHFDLTGYVNDSYGSPGITQIDYRYQQFAIQFGHSFVPAEDHTVTWGIDSRFDLLDATSADPQMLSRGFLSTGIVGVYVKDQWRFAPKWTLDVGARVDYEFYGGIQPSARGSLSYELTPESLLYGAVSRAFQMPPVGLRFLDMPFLNGLSWATSDRDVDAETLNAYELGYRAKYFERLDVSLNLFWHDYADVTTLSPRLGPPGLVALDFDNRGSAMLYGAEFDATLKVLDNLSLLGHYTYQEFEWRSSAGFHDKDSMSPPKHKAMLGVRYSPMEAFHLSGQLHFVGDTRARRSDFPLISRTIDEYTRLDLRAEYEFYEDTASFSVGVRNLLDNHHPEGSTQFMDFAEVPRMIYAEMRWRIK